MTLIDEAAAVLGAALNPSDTSDSRALKSTIWRAYKMLDDFRKKDRPHTHRAGTTVGKHIDECALCGHDIRHSIHNTPIAALKAQGEKQP